MMDEMIVAPDPDPAVVEAEAIAEAATEALAVAAETAIAASAEQAALGADMLAQFSTLIEPLVTAMERQLLELAVLREEHARLHRMLEELLAETEAVEGSDAPEEKPAPKPEPDDAPARRSERGQRRWIE